MSRFSSLYQDTIVPELTKKFGYKTVMQVPRITKITLNMGVGEAVNDKKLVDNAVADMTKIAGQKPVVTRTRKAIANFKIRENMPIGCMVTLRGERMYDFLDRLVTVAFPRVRDFRGVSGRAFDGRGNYNIGLKEQIIFPEIALSVRAFALPAPPRGEHFCQLSLLRQNLSLWGEVASRSDDGEVFARSRPVCLIHSRVLSGVRYSEISMGSPSAHRCSRS